MINKIIFTIFLTLIISSALFSQTTKEKKVKRLSLGSFQIIAKDTSLTVEVLTISKTKGIEIITLKNGEKKRFKKRTIYLINCSSDDNQGRTIISIASKLKGHPKIKIGKKYKLFLIPYFEEDCIPGDGNEVIYIDKIIIPNVRVLGINVYKTPNLKGLFYIPAENQ
ncbi:MAG: hypothetical protein ACOYOV_09995 [Bacteroidales bacterium]